MQRNPSVADVSIAPTVEQTDPQPTSRAVDFGRHAGSPGSPARTPGAGHQPQPPMQKPKPMPKPRGAGGSAKV